MHRGSAVPRIRRPAREAQRAGGRTFLQDTITRVLPAKRLQHYPTNTAALPFESNGIAAPEILAAFRVMIGHPPAGHRLRPVQQPVGLWRRTSVVLDLDNLARTLADLDKSVCVRAPHIGEALTSRVLDKAAPCGEPSA